MFDSMLGAELGGNGRGSGGLFGPSDSHTLPSTQADPIQNLREDAQCRGAPYNGMPCLPLASAPLHAK